MIGTLPYNILYYTALYIVYYTDSTNIHKVDGPIEGVIMYYRISFYFDKNSGTCSYSISWEKGIGDLPRAICLRVDNFTLLCYLHVTVLYSATLLFITMCYMKRLLCRPMVTPPIFSIKLLYNLTTLCFEWGTFMC